MRILAVPDAFSRQLPRLAPWTAVHRPRLVVTAFSPMRSLGDRRELISNGGARKAGLGLSFDGVDDYLDCGAAPIAQSTTVHTIVAVTTLRSWTAGGVYPILFNYYTTNNDAGQRRKLFFADASTGYEPVTFGAHGASSPFVAGFSCSEIGGRNGILNRRISWVFRQTSDTAFSGWAQGRSLAINGSAATNTNTQSGNNCIARSSTNDPSNHAQVDIDLLVYFESGLPDVLCQELSARPGLIFAQQRRRLLFAVSGGGAYTLVADSGSYVHSGVGAGLFASRLLPADPGAYAHSGQAAGLARGNALAADPGAYAHSGQAAGLLAARRVVADQGAYALAGQAAGLLASKLLTAAQGGYALAGQDAGLGRGAGLVADAGAYAHSGQAAGLLAARRLVADQGSYGLNGQTANLVYTPAGAFVLVAEAGSYALSGQPANVLAARRLPADFGVYSIAGQAAGLSAATNRTLTADFGSYALTGQSAQLVITRLFSAQTGYYSLAGQALTLAYSGVPADVAYPLRGRSGSFPLSGRTINDILFNPQPYPLSGRTQE